MLIVETAGCTCVTSTEDFAGLDLEVRNGVGAGAFAQSGSAVLDFPDGLVGRQAVALQEPSAKLLHISQPQMFLGAIFAGSSGPQAEAEQHGGGEVAGDQQPEITNLPGAGLKNEEVAFNIVELDALQKPERAALAIRPDAHAVAVEPCLGDVGSSGGGALMKQGSDGFGEQVAGFDLSENVRVVPTCGGRRRTSNIELRTSNVEAVAGDGFAVALGIQTGAPLAFDA